MLARKGTYVLVGHEGFANAGSRWIGRSLGRFLKLLILSPFVSQRMSPMTSKDTNPPLVVLSEFIGAGKIIAVIDRTFPLSEVPDAIRYLEQGGVRGKVVIAL